MFWSSRKYVYFFLKFSTMVQYFFLHNYGLNIVSILFSSFLPLHCRHMILGPWLFNRLKNTSWAHISFLILWCLPCHEVSSGFDVYHHICMHKHVYMYVYTCLYVFVYVCIYVHVCIWRLLEPVWNSFWGAKICFKWKTPFWLIRCIVEKLLPLKTCICLKQVAPCFL